jgi:hypothetical protein
MTGILSTIEKDINIAETWVTSAASKVEQAFAKGATLAPEIVSDLTTVVSTTEDFLAAATPAVAGDGLNFPADSVAYAKFVALVAAWQKLGVTVIADLKKG